MKIRSILIVAGAAFGFSQLTSAQCPEICENFSKNTAVGLNALDSNTAGFSNTAMGNAALQANTTGTENTAMGVSALLDNTTGGVNTAIGSDALLLNTTGDFNTACGSSALISNTTGSNNTACGYDALHDNSTGSNNTVMGVEALSNNTSGGFNTAIADFALRDNATGDFNTALGHRALLHNTTGSRNIAIGESAGGFLTTGDHNIDIGAGGVTGESNTTRIGKTDTQTATYIAGINGVTVAGGVGVLIDSNGHLGTNTSSARYKENIQPMARASEAILALQPVTFRYKHELDPDDIPQFGLVAEQVEKVNPDLVARDDEGKACTVRYEAVNAMLLNEFLKEHRKVQELETTVTLLKSAAAQQKDLRATVAKLQSALEAQSAQIQKVSDQLASNGPQARVAANDQ